MPRHAPDSRTAIRRAATAEFAARGFDGAGVDRIARRAGVNKAMIYYHFRDKAHLYQDIVREMFSAIRARTGKVAAAPLAPARKLDGFIDAIVAEAAARPCMPPMMMREAADGGRRLDTETFRTMVGIFANLSSILAEGERTHAFRRVDPVLMHFTLVGPIVMYLTGSAVRHAIGRLKQPGLPPSQITAAGRHLTSDGDVHALGEHLKEAARRALRPDPAHGRTPQASKPRANRRRPAAGRSGEQA